MYGLPPDVGPDQGQGHDHASTSMLPPSSTSSSYRHDPLQQHQHQHQAQNNQYPFAFDSYPPLPPGGPSTSVPAYEYSYGRGPQGETHPPFPVNVDTMSNAFGHDPAGSWGSPYHGAGAMPHDRGMDRGEQHMQSSWAGEGQMYGDFTGHGDMNRNPSGMGNGQGDEGDWRRSASGWGNEYGRQAGNDAGVERELENLRLHLNDLVESIRPYASSPSNPNPPRPPSYVQSRFVKLASTIQSTLSSLQPHMHPSLHPEFDRLPPTSSKSNSTGAASTIKPLTAAEKEMEVIRKRRDMLIARAAQVQASSHPSAIHQHQYQPQPSYHMQQSHSGSSPLSSHMYNNPVAPSWKHSELYQTGGGLYSTGPASNPMSANNSGSPFTAVPFDSIPAMTASKKSMMNMDSFDASLARFSLDPTKIGADGLAKKPAPEGGRCHGCGVNVTAEWRRGPDGPRSLCNACGLHYAKLTRKRALEEANANGQAVAAPA